MTPSIVLLGFALIATALVSVAVLHGKQRLGRERAIDEYRFPAGIRNKVAKRYPHLSESDLDLVFRALREYFHLSRKAHRRLLAMPSQVVDVAWHEFILFTRNYQDFCRRALGRYLHHTPAEAMPDRTAASDGIKRTWRLACLRAGIDPKTPAALPLLFAIDNQLRIEDGFNYALNCTHMVGAGQATSYCASHIGCGSGCGGGCAGSGCSSGDGGGDGCGGGGD